MPQAAAFWRRRWKPALLLILVLAAAALYETAAVAATSARILSLSRYVPWSGERVFKTETSLAGLNADVYTASRSRSPILLIHGVTETGKDTPEVRPVAEGLAEAGFRVVVPQFPRLTRQNVTPEDVEDVVAAFQWLQTDGGILCASYGCGPGLVAAADPRIRERVRFVVAFGAYFDLTEQLRFIITEQGETPFAYSKWKYLAANTDWLESPDDRRQLIAFARERELMPPEKWTLSFKDLKPSPRAAAQLFESRNAEEFAARLAEVPRLRDRLERLSPSRHMEYLRARLIIVHIASDPSIPSTQSQRLAAAAQAMGIPHRLTLLNMYGHTRPAWPEFGVRSLFSFYIPEGVKFGRVVNEILSFVN